MNFKIAQVIVNVPARGLNKPFSYIIPEQLDFLDTGWRVAVPFGGRKAEGFIVEVSNDGSGQLPPEDLKQVLFAFDENKWFDDDMIEIAKWISEYYLTSFSQALRLFIPGKSGLKFLKNYCFNEFLDLNYCLDKLVAKPLEYSLLLKYIHKNKTVARIELKKIFEQIKLQNGDANKLTYENSIDYLLRHKFICAAETAVRTGTQAYRTVICLTKPIDSLEALETILRRKPAQQKLIRELLSRNNKTIDSSELKKLRITANTINNLAKIGLIEIKKEKILRDSYSDRQPAKAIWPELSPGQKSALDCINAAIDSSKFESFLLKGVTGSGKTQVYIQAAARTRSLNRQAIILVPEIALTSQIVTRFKAAFGNDVVVIHSKLSVSERNDAWQRIYSNQAGVVIGARSAVFAPVTNLGIIILDEEHEFTYKQEESPRYHAKQVALKRASLAGAAVVFGSATPSVETYYEALSGEHKLLSMENRINDAALPPITVVDMRQELAEGRRKVISPAMADMLTQTLFNKEQAIILLNRRGYATFILCRECGHVLKCSHCDVSLVYHTTSQELICHYCRSRHSVPDTCPSCESRYIRYFGSGTQRVEEELRSIFAEAKIARMDQDTTGGKMGHDKILAAFARKEYNVLLGTQMVAKGHDVPEVTAVGIISADTTLNLPDFRAAEKAFSLIMQAAGRAGRGQKPGKVVLQTYNPEHYAITSAAGHNYELFFNQEITYRRELGYPPFCRLIKLRVESPSETEIRRLSAAISKKLNIDLENLPGTFIIGPFPASTYKVKDIYRINLLIKTTPTVASQVKNQIRLSGILDLKEISIDVDPISVL